MRLLTKGCNSSSFSREGTTVRGGGAGSAGPGPRGQPFAARGGRTRWGVAWAGPLFPCSAAPSPLVQPSFPLPCRMVIEWHQPAPGRLLFILQTSRKVWGVRGSWECRPGRQRVAPCCLYFGLNRTLTFISLGFARARRAFEPDSSTWELPVVELGKKKNKPKPKTAPPGALSLNPLQRAYRQATLLDFEPKLLFT